MESQFHKRLCSINTVMASTDWNTVTSDLQRAANNLAWFVLESMTLPEQPPMLTQTLSPLPEYKPSSDCVTQQQQPPSNPSDHFYGPFDYPPPLLPTSMSPMPQQQQQQQQKATTTSVRKKRGSKQSLSSLSSSSSSILQQPTTPQQQQQQHLAMHRPSHPGIGTVVDRLITETLL